MPSDCAFKFWALEGSITVTKHVLDEVRGINMFP